MRSLLRSKARAGMKIKGIQKMNKERWGVNPTTGMPEKMPSYFAQYWREYAAVMVK